MSAAADAAARALDAVRALTIGGAAQALPHPRGTLLRSPDEPRAFVANQLLLDRSADLDARGLIAVLDEALDGFGHRRAVITDDAEGARLHAALLPHGWGGGAQVVMVLAPDAPPAAIGVADVPVAPEARVRAVGLRSDVASGLEPAVAEQLARVRARERAARGARGVVVAVDGQDAAHATLHRTGPVFQIEDVVTLPPYRGRGLARRVIASCVREARAQGAELVVIVADADDSPRELYARMGFAPVAQLWVVQREVL
ncbi:GNAT family N-acetyltransferase [Conexibacter sp. W3-3-2]|uniref:GNAT family N-acetyltransferase n=1 Tax=Conexibacter sp. W3-3-2 TaxID=2675227 RepID=UPI0012B9C949|nr:GNAT family N-acetyltransferase [Conexibacter sp. W3-3-2]MTD46571.1 GNAT family N-acetyltransferase [Conexibacter sp. W3-3-2]